MAAKTTTRARKSATTKTSGKRTGTSTIEALLREMRRAPAKAHKISDLIAATTRPAPTVYSVIYGEARRDNARVTQVSRGTFKLTPSGKVQS